MRSMYADGERIVQMTDMSLQLTGLTPSQLGRCFGASRRLAVGETPTIFNREQSAFAIGKPSEAFGEPYRIFDTIGELPACRARHIAFIDRIVESSRRRGSSSPAAGSRPSTTCHRTHGISRRIDSRPCRSRCCLKRRCSPADGWRPISARPHQRDRSFVPQPRRHGHATRGGLPRQRHADHPRAHDQRLEGRRHDHPEIRHAGPCGSTLIYEGTTLFGFFSAEALAKQVGIRDASERRFRAASGSNGRFDLPDEPPFTPDAVIPPESNFKNPRSLLLPAVPCE